MSSFTVLRVLVTLVVTVSLLSTESTGRPLPSPTPISLRRSPQQLVSTSPTLALPPLIIAGQRRASSFTQQRPEPIILTKRAIGDEVASRAEIHEHEHIHEHGHDSDYYDYPDRWTQEEMDHHSDHWAWHHGLLDGNDEKDVHAHVHEHIHVDKREAEETTTTKRGIIDDLGTTVKSLLGPLEVLPGFISIENLLFGDGDQNGGLLKTVGGLLLKVEPSQTTQSPNEYSFSLLASKKERTQVYLAPVNSTSDQECNDDTNGDILTVRVKLPLVDMKGSAILMCASVANAPPSAMSLESCGPDESSDSISMNGTSQFFTYTRSTGSLTPILMQAQSTNNAVKATNTLASQDDGAANSTAAATSDDNTSEDPTKSKMLMHFTLVSNTTLTGMDDGTAGTSDFPMVEGTAGEATPSSEDMTRRQSATLDDGSAMNSTAGDDTSKIFLAVTLLADGSQPDDAATLSPSPSKLCKAKM